MLINRFLLRNGTLAVHKRDVYSLTGCNEFAVIPLINIYPMIFVISITNPNFIHSAQKRNLVLNVCTKFMVMPGSKYIVRYEHCATSIRVMIIIVHLKFDLFEKSGTLWKHVCILTISVMVWEKAVKLGHMVISNLNDHIIL